jgi:signal transduction histidine kinase/CheY-like chemotaxis protein/purine-cytosine permease-like protein
MQRVVKIRRDYNTWVANETLEDYALRFTPRSYRRWSEMRVANTAFGAASFLVLEAVGATLLVNYGFTNAALAILATGLIIFLAGLPISVYAARYGVDMDLLTRGAGFGYMGSTLTSLIYASFTFIFFALEAAIMAYALELAFGLPPLWGYMVCTLVVIPLVTHGISVISRVQTLTQPIWVVLLVLPFVFLAVQAPHFFSDVLHYSGSQEQGAHFDFALFGGAMAVALALITQMGEQVDYLRFMPACKPENRRRWWASVLIGGPGWVIPGVIKMLGGALLAYVVIRHGIPAERAVDPNQMYLVAYQYVFPNLGWAIAATTIFVVISQLKINVTNAYAGSLAWSNFFSRLTHNHPGRVVWVVFNTLIALMLMEMELFQALGRVLALYSNVAVAWMMVVVADLVINKPMGWSPPGIEFRRAYLYDINPVGTGAMLSASILSIAAYLGLLGATLQPYAIFIALGVAFLMSPLIAWATRGRYYIARQPVRHADESMACTVCGKVYEREDMAACPAYQGNICSLCCVLDARCHDACKPQARLPEQWAAIVSRLLPRSAKPYLEAGLAQYVLLMLGIVSFLALLISLLYFHEFINLGSSDPALVERLRGASVRTFVVLTLVAGIFAWWLVLTQRSRQFALEESNRHNQLLAQEIESHRHTDDLLQGAKRIAEQANQAKSRYITAISHELRTPLNSILGYAQILDGDPAIPANRRQAVNVIRRSGDHLLSLIEGTLDIARIEGGKLSLNVQPLDFHDFMQQIVGMFELQARNKGLRFRYEPQGELPAWVRADEHRLRQILINILGNAVKFTTHGQVTFHLRYQREMAIFEVEDTGPGIAPEELAHIFEPFSRGSAAYVGATGGTGLGLTIAKMLTDLMGGQMSVESTPGAGSRFRMRLYLPQSSQTAATLRQAQRVGYVGVRRRILIVDNEKTDREFLASVLEPLGFPLAHAASGLECLEMIPRFRPHLIFMDLAMPGIDGWETIRRIRSRGLSDAEIAVISANAFEKGADNDAAIATENFITKPVRVDELLDWIGRHLGLAWVTAEAAPTEITAAPTAAPPAAPKQLRYPSAEHLRILDEQIQLGYMRGIHTKLDEIAQLDAGYADFIEVMRQLARQFQFDAMCEILRKGYDEGPHGGA